MHHDHRDLIERLAARTVRLIHAEYPNSIRLTLHEAPDGPITPRALYPAFFGCYDWHSAVHSHWQLVRAVRTLPDAPFAAVAIAAIDTTLTADNIATEMRWTESRPNFEMPYGMGWLLALCAELRAWAHPVAERWLAALAPMEAHAQARFAAYCSTMTTPIRGGMHGQTAFALALAHDHATLTSSGLRASIAESAESFYLADRDVDLRHEPSAADFLSPALAEADLLRRVLAPGRFHEWFDRFAPTGLHQLRPVAVVDPTDGQLAHWAGLNLSRSWMLDAVADALPAGHAQLDGLRSSAASHAAAGLAICEHDHDMISHWVPTFAVLRLTRTLGPVG